MGTVTRIYVIIVILIIHGWLSVSAIDCALYDSRPWHIVQFVFVKHGYDCTVCVDDMTFRRGAGPNAGQVCRIILPEELRGDTLCL